MESLRFGIIGTGSVVREIYADFYFHSVYAPLIRVEAICDLDEATLHAFGDAHDIPPERRFTDYGELLSKVELDAVAVNTPDRLHAAPTIAALAAGLDVLLAKPLAATVKDALAMRRAALENGRLLGVDFHKRHDPPVMEARVRVLAGEYGNFQSAVWYMLDKLLVADPNHVPRFFASKDYAAKNTPVSFLTVHMADTFTFITELEPVEIRATAYKQKLPSLQPIPVDGYDMVDTEILLQHGGTCHILTGWAMPNAAHATTVQSARMIFSDGLLDLDLDRIGYREITAGGIAERNVAFLSRGGDDEILGFGMDSPGLIVRNILALRNGKMSREELAELTSPFRLGFHATVICEAAHRSLDNGTEIADGVVRGVPVAAADLMTA